MAITTPAGVVNALGNSNSQITIDKANTANQTAGRLCSLWRATGIPAQAAIPGTTAAIPTSATLGGIPFTNQTDPAKSYIDWLWAIGSNNGQSLEVYDRVAHTGGLVLNIITSQTVGAVIDVLTLALVAARRGDASYRDLQWWLEVYTDGGATASNATINVTYNDATTGNLNTLAVGGTIRAGNMFPLTQLIPTAQQGKYIRGINSVILSASTGTAGNFGFTCGRLRTVQEQGLANFPSVNDWAKLGHAEVPNDACLFFVCNPSTTSSGTFRGGGKITHG